MGELFKLVRDRVSALEAAQTYGMEFGRNRRARCPWHDDQRPDLAFYDNRCYCHACHEGGDAIALTAQLFGLEPLEAARKLNADFRLGVDETTVAQSVGPSKAEERRELEEWRRKRFHWLCQVEREAKEALARGPKGAELSTALTALGLVQDELELLHIATIDELRAMREEVASGGNG